MATRRRHASRCGAPCQTRLTTILLVGEPGVASPDSAPLPQPSRRWRVSSRIRNGSPGDGSPGDGSPGRLYECTHARRFAGTLVFARWRTSFERRSPCGRGRSRRSPTPLRASAFAAEREEASRSRGRRAWEGSLSGYGGASFHVARVHARRRFVARGFASFVVDGSGGSFSSRAAASLLGDFLSRRSLEHEDTRRAGGEAREARAVQIPRAPELCRGRRGDTLSPARFRSVDDRSRFLGGECGAFVRAGAGGEAGDLGVGKGTGEWLGYVCERSDAHPGHRWFRTFGAPRFFAAIYGRGIGRTSSLPRRVAADHLIFQEKPCSI